MEWKFELSYLGQIEMIRNLKCKTLFFHLVLFSLIGCMEEGVFKIAIPIDETFTEDLAIEVTRKALVKAGHDISLIEPEPFRKTEAEGENFFARNSINRNNGYVLWKKKGEKKYIHYVVSVKRKKNYVICDIGRSK